MGASDVVYVEKRRGPRTDPWGTPVTKLCALDTFPPQATLKDRPVRYDSNQQSGIPVMSSDERVDRRIWWLTVSKAADRSSRMRTDDLESAFWCCVVQTCKIEQSLQCALWRSAGHQRLHQDFWLKLMGKLLMNLTESWSHAVELELQGRQGAQSLPGWAVDDVLSSMPRCPPGSLRSMQLPLDHLVEMRDRAVCHQRRNGRRSHVPV